MLLFRRQVFQMESVDATLLVSQSGFLYFVDSNNSLIRQINSVDFMFTPYQVISHFSHYLPLSITYWDTVRRKPNLYISDFGNILICKFNGNPKCPTLPELEPNPQYF
jgi:hypothetical protein